MKKKWFIVILALVIVAIVLAIVFINLFKERDTKALSEKLLEVTETGYLSPTFVSEKDGSEENLLIECLTGLKGIGSVENGGEFSQNDFNTISNYLDALSAYEISIEFFAREMIFAKATDTYTNNHVKVQNWLSDAQKNANSIKDHINEYSSKAEGSNFWTAQIWQRCRDWMGKLVKDTSDAVEMLTQIYRDSVPSHIAHKGIMNNGFTDIIFDAMNALDKDMFDKLTESADLGEKLFRLTNAYLLPEKEELILNYPYDENLQQKVKEVKENKDSPIYEDFLSGGWANA